MNINIISSPPVSLMRSSQFCELLDCSDLRSHDKPLSHARGDFLPLFGLQIFYLLLETPLLNL